MTQGIKRMAKAELGTKRTCLSCNMRFYDFNRRPITCPGCGAEFKAVNLIKRQTARRKPKEETKITKTDFSSPTPNRLYSTSFVTTTAPGALASSGTAVLTISFKTTTQKKAPKSTFCFARLSPSGTLQNSGTNVSRKTRSA